MDLYAVIMAGGVGARFWPRSRQKAPKQLLKIFNNDSLIQNTVKRLEGLIPIERIFIVTNDQQKPGIIEQLPDIPIENIIIEPFGKNTAACIGLASILLKKINPDALTIVLPADHHIENIKKFEKTIKAASDFALQNNALVTIGINPAFPHTGYGYIQTNDSAGIKNIFKVKTFAEKPNYETAKRFISSGDFLWNSGMFIWKVDAILNEFSKYMPEHFEGFEKIQNAIGTKKFKTTLKREYGQLKSISIDYGIMEKSKSVYVIKGEFDWSDVGDWEAVYQLSQKDNNENIIKGDVYFENTTGSYIHSEKKFTAVLGVDDLIVIETENALLICDRKNAQSVKSVVDHLRLNKREDLL